MPTKIIQIKCSTCRDIISMWNPKYITVVYRSTPLVCCGPLIEEEVEL